MATIFLYIIVQHLHTVDTASLQCMLYTNKDIYTLYDARESCVLQRRCVIVLYSTNQALLEHLSSCATLL